jgi:putative ABC transport system permease protein
VGLGMVAVGLKLLDRFLEENSNGRPPFWIDPGLSVGTVLYAVGLAVLSAVIIGALPALRATGAQLRAAMGSLGSDTKARLGKTWTVLIVAQVAMAVAVLPPAIRQGGQMVRVSLQEPTFPPGEYLATWLSVERDADAVTTAREDSAAADSARAITTALLARLEDEPGVVGMTVTKGTPWSGGVGSYEVEGADRPPERVRVLAVDTSYFGVFGVQTIAGRSFAAADAALPYGDRPVVVNRTFVTEVLGGGEPVGRRVRLRSFADKESPWHVVVGVVEDSRVALRDPAESGARLYRVTTPAELGNNSRLMIRLRAQTVEGFTPTLRRIAASVDPMLQLSPPQSLQAIHQEDARNSGLAAIVVALITGSVLLLSAAGIHALVSFTVNQRRREIGIRAALGAPTRRILTGVLTRATRQIALGVGIGLTIAVVLDRTSGGVLLNGTGLLLVPATAAFMLVVGLLAAAGPARRGLRVQPTEALRTE